jgi:hypothetical protein
MTRRTEPRIDDHSRTSVELGWCLVSPTGEVLFESFGKTKTDCWDNGFREVAYRTGKLWEQKYWMRSRASRASAQRFGWRFVRYENILKPARKSRRKEVA